MQAESSLPAIYIVRSRFRSRRFVAVNILIISAETLGGTAVPRLHKWLPTLSEKRSVYHIGKVQGTSLHT